MIYETAAGATTTAFNLYIEIADNGETYSGDGTSGVYIFGAQLEELAYPTSFIYDGTEGSTTTRAADQINNISGTFNSSGGVFVCEMSALYDDLTERAISVSDGTNANRVKLYYSTTTNQLVALLDSNSVNQATITYTLTDETQYSKIAFRYYTDDFKLFVDGAIVGTPVTSGSTFPHGTLTEYSFDEGDGTSDFYGRMKSSYIISGYKTDTQCINLTK